MSLIELRITDVGVIRSAQLAAGEGLVALTGETGSGKSVTIAALRLALGARSDLVAVRRGAERGMVAAVFDDVPAAVQAQLTSLGIAGDDLLTLSRELRPQGRGACRINGALVPLATLREVAENLVEVTGQGESQRLLRPGWQRSLLDAFAGAPCEQARAAATRALRTWREVRAQLEAAHADVAQTEARRAEARAILAELGPLALLSGEDEALARERDRLRRMAGLRAVAASVQAACTGGEDGGTACDILAAAIEDARALQGVDDEVDRLLAAGTDALATLHDLAVQARTLEEGLETDPARLAAVEERLDVLDRVRRRHGGSLDAALAALAAAQADVAAAEDRGTAVDHLADEVEHAAARAAEAVERLSRTRAAAATRFERAVTSRLRQLRMPHARLRVSVRQTPADDGLLLAGRTIACGPDGADAVEMRLATTADGIPLPLDAGPSGGELSRLALAVRATVSAVDDCPTLVLDEVDGGIGGQTAARVGEVLAAIAATRQVVVVTHRAEIACRAQTQVVASRRDTSSGAETTLQRVEAADRIEEIARMLSGRPTASALARAEELLAEGRAPSLRAPLSPPDLAARTIAPG